MKVVIQFLCGLILLVSMNAHAQTPPASDPKVDALLKDYLDSWQTTDSGARLAKLEKIWTANAMHESPFAKSVGIKAISDEIEGFQKMFPNAGVKFENLKKTGKNLMVAFELRKADGTIAATGYDYIELDEGGKIVKVIGFVN